MNNGMHKYKKIVREDILKLFKERKIVATNYVSNTYGCSDYLAIRHIETLVEDGMIKRSKCGYIKV